MGSCNPKYDKIEDLYFIGSDGKLYKYEYFKNNNKKDNVMFVYNLIKYKLNKCYEMRLRNNYLPLLKNLQLKQDVFINVVEYSYSDMDLIYEEFRANKRINHVLLDYFNEIGCNDHEHITSTFNSKNETNIVNLSSSPKEDLGNSFALNITMNTNIRNLNYIKEEKYKICGFTPKISNKLKTKTFISILENNVKKDIIKNYFMNIFDSPYKYFIFKNSIISSYSTNFMISYILYTIHLSPSNIMMYHDKGAYINKNLFSLKFMNELQDSNLRMYISPNIQHFFGREGVEGPYLSILYQSCQAINDEDFIDNLVDVYFKRKDQDIKNKIKERVNEITKVEGNDFNIIKLINEWTDVENLAKVTLLDNPWL